MDLKHRRSLNSYNFATPSPGTVEKAFSDSDKMPIVSSALNTLPEVSLVADLLIGGMFYCSAHNH